jgi:hypothetical protein
MYSSSESVGFVYMCQNQKTLHQKIGTYEQYQYSVASVYMFKAGSVSYWTSKTSFEYVNTGHRQRGVLGTFYINDKEIG